MAMTLDTAIKFTAKLEGTGLDQLKRGLQSLSQQSNVSKRSLDQLYTATKVLGSASNNTIAGLQKTTTALRVLRDQADFGSRKFNLLTRDIEAAEARLRRFQSTADRSAGVSRGGALLAGAAGGVAGALAVQGGALALRGAQGAVQVGLDAESAQVRLRALTDEFGEYNAALAATDRIAKTLRLSNTEAQASFASLYASLRPTGITLQEIEKAFIGFSAAARNSGATAEETSNALIQLKQALASGVLQGDELRSIREQAPLAAQAIAKELGSTIGELKDLASEGKVTTDVVLRALGKLQDTQLGKLSEQFQTGQQAIKDFQVAAQGLGIELQRIFGPTAISLLRNFTGALKEASDVLGGITGNGDAGQRAQLRVQANQQAARETNDKFGIFSFLQQGSKNQFLLKREQEIYQRLLRQQTRPADQVSDSQREAQQRAANERASAAERTSAAERSSAADRSAMEKAKNNLADQLKIREDIEKRLADFREQSIRRAADLERDFGDQRIELERSIAEARRRIAAQEQDAAFERVRQRLRGAGLGTDALDTQARLNEATRRFTEQTFQIEQQATDRRVQLERTIEDYKISVARGTSDILQDAADKMAQKMVAGAREAAGQLGGGTASPGSVGRGQLGGGNLAALGRSSRSLNAALVANFGVATTSAVGDLSASRQSELGNITSELDSQRKSTTDQLRDYQQILDLQRSGMSPEIAKQRVDAENAAVAEAVKLVTLRDQLVLDREIAGLTDQQKATIDAMITSIEARDAAQMKILNGLTAEQQQLERLRQAYEEKKQLVEGISNSIGNGIGSAIDLLIDGTDNWGDSLRSIAAGVLKDIARQIAQTMVIAPIVKGITSAFGFANGGIMTGDGPMPLRKYAGGGIANSPQLAMFGEGSMPEAYVPLPDGRRIPVAMKGGGGTNVVVNVDASGSQVQGDAGRGEQLGRAISQAVQAELIKQKRPGGLLTA